MSHTRTFKLTRTVEVDVEFEVETEPGEKGTPRTMDGPGTPDYAPSAYIVAASVGGVGVPLDCIDRGDLRRLEDEALEEAMEAERDAFEAAMEDRADRERDDRLCGER